MATLQLCGPARAPQQAVGFAQVHASARQAPARAFVAMEKFGEMGTGSSKRKCARSPPAARPSGGCTTAIRPPCWSWIPLVANRVESRAGGPVCRSEPKGETSVGRDRLQQEGLNFSDEGVSPLARTLGSCSFARAPRCYAPGSCIGRAAAAPQHFLYLRCEPHQHGSLRPGGHGIAAPAAKRSAA